MNLLLRRTMLACGAIAFVVASCGESTAPEVASPSPAEQVARGWAALPASSLSPRSEAHAFWTGERVLVIGGNDGQPCPPNADCAMPPGPALSDGAAFDPASGEWTAIAPAPMPLGDISGAVMPDVLYVYIPGFEPAAGARSSFLAYHIPDDRWEELDVPPVPGGTSLTLVATGNKVVGFHPTQERGVTSDLLYDPATGDWTDLPADPLVPSFDRSAVWTGQELLLLGVEVVPQPNAARPSLYRAAGLDLATGAWRRLPDSEVLGWDPAWFWAADRLINPSVGSADGGQVNNWGRAFPFGGILDPGSGSWSPLPDPPAAANVYQGLSVGGPDYIVSSAGFVLHAPALTWEPLAKPRAGEEAGAASVWAGDRLFVWGGVRSNGAGAALLGDGWTWQP